jgi:hypothetical protein
VGDEDGHPLPVLLTFDSAPSHAAVRAIEACAKSNIIVLTFPPHVLQPIDVQFAGDDLPVLGGFKSHPL